VKLKYFLQLPIIFLIGSCTSNMDYTQFVNPFIGTQHEGPCFPGATVSMGMVQISPESTCKSSFNKWSYFLD